MNLGDWRSRIDDLDNQILNLLNQRAEAALRTGDLQRRQDAPSYAHERLEGDHPDTSARVSTNLTRTESSPATGRPRESVTFVDVEDPRDVAPVTEALAEMGERTRLLRVLGSRPAA